MSGSTKYMMEDSRLWKDLKEKERWKRNGTGKKARRRLE